MRQFISNQWNLGFYSQLKKKGAAAWQSKSIDWMAVLSICCGKTGNDYKIFLKKISSWLCRPWIRSDSWESWIFKVLDRKFNRYKMTFGDGLPLSES